ncbi:MAG: signal peptide peptidase SppA [Rhodospirillales bacterium]|nr:signal peptide peptidase SppA [Rhodospirillales bacterium]
MSRMKLFATLLVWPFVIVGCGPVTFVVGLSPGRQQLRETVVVEDAKAERNQVAIIDVSGLLVNMRRPGLLEEGENPVSLLHEQLNRAASDSNVKAVVLRINSPGGTVTASDAMHREVDRFREQTGKPVVALMMDVAASGAYYVACASDEIVAYPTAITGSVGVIIQTISVKPALTRIGVETEAIVSGPNKEAGSPFANMSEQHRAVLQELVDDFYARFTDVVRENRRKIAAENFAMLTDGRVVSGEDAAQYGLVDHTGDIYDAFARAKVLAKIDRAKLVRYHRPLEHVASPYAVTGAQAGTGSPRTQVNLVQFNMADQLPGFDGPVGFYYLWQPNLK